MSEHDTNKFNDWSKEENAECNNITPHKIWHKVIYKDSGLRAVLLFIGICTINIVSVYPFNTGYWYFVEPVDPVLPSIVVLAFYLLVFVFLLVYTIMCCRQRMCKQLTGITAAFGLISLNSLITSGIFFPIFNALSLVFSFITNAPDHGAGPNSLIVYILNIVSLIIYAFLSGYAISFKYDVRLKKHCLSLGKITVILSVLSAVFLVVYGFAFAKYEWAYDECYTECPQEYYLSEITSQQRKVYTDIKIGDDVNKTEKALVKKGFVKKNKNYEEYMWDCLFPYYIDEYIEPRNPEKNNENNCAIYCYNIGMEDSDNYDDVVSCIIVSYNDKGKINYKMFIPNANDYNICEYYFSCKHGEETRGWYNNIEKGDSSESTLNFIRNTGAFIIEDEKYIGKTKENTYKINLNCYYSLRADFIDFLLDRYPDDVNYSYDIELTVIDDVVTEKKISNPW